MHRILTIFAIVILLFSCSGNSDNTATIRVGVESSDVYARSAILPSDGDGNTLENYDISHYKFFLYSGRDFSELLLDEDPVESDYLERGEDFVLDNVVTGYIWIAEVIAYIDPDGGRAGNELIPIASGKSAPVVIGGGDHYISLVLDELADDEDYIINKHHPAETEGESIIQPGSAEITINLPSGIERDEHNNIIAGKNVYIRYTILDRAGEPLEGFNQIESEYPISRYDDSGTAEIEDDKYQTVLSIKDIPQGTYTILIEIRHDKNTDHIVRVTAESLRILPSVISSGLIDLYDTTVAVTPEIRITDSLGETIEIIDIEVPQKAAALDADGVLNDLSVTLTVPVDYNATFYIDGKEATPADNYVFKDIASGDHTLLIVIEKDGEPLTHGSYSTTFRVDYSEGTIGGEN